MKLTEVKMGEKFSRGEKIAPFSSNREAEPAVDEASVASVNTGMCLAGVIAEYNPFHNGHAHQLAEARRHGATHIAVAMSGPFVQRGGIAIVSKFARARAALESGADLVLELPVPYALASAPDFARAGIFLLRELGADCLSFGCEEGDPQKLREAARLCAGAERSDRIGELLGKGWSYPRARAAVVEELAGREWAERITAPNNLLAIEYIRAIEQIAPGMELLAIPRVGAGHDRMEAGGKIASASYLRRLLERDGLAAIERYVPPGALRIYREELTAGRAPVLQSAIERIAMERIRGLTAEDFASLPGVAEGLENRLLRAAAAASSVEDFCMRVKTKRYTLARIRRIAFAALLGIRREDQQHDPAYLRVLGMNERGKEILARAKRSAGVPAGVNFADLYRLSPPGLELDLRAEELFALASPVIQPRGRDFTERMIVVESE